MKKYFSFIVAVATMFAVTSCSQEEVINESSQDFVSATFTIGTADAIGSRAIGDGTTVNTVTCAVFDANGAEMTELRKDETVTDKKATYNVRLVKGQAYRIAFFAYDNTANAYDVTDMKSIKLLGNQASNMENRDAFTNYIDIEAVKTLNAIEEDVILYRPFAQLNMGIDGTELEDARKAGVVVTNTQVIVKNVYNAFSAFDNAIAADATAGDMTFALNGIPTEKLVVNGEEYNYLAMNYLLVGDMGDEKGLADIEFVWATADGKTNNPTAHFLNIPVQRNYRTNIIGKLLTNPATFNIIIDEEFETPDYVVSYLDPVLVNSWDEFIELINSTDFNPEKQYVCLGADVTYTSNFQLNKNVIIDLNGKSMTLPMLNIHSKATVKNGTINGKVYARKNSDIIFDNVIFSGEISDNLSTDGHLAIQGGCDVYAKNCVFRPTSVGGSQTKPLSVEGRSSGSLKFENCEFKSSPYKKQVYVNPLNGTATLDFTNCNFNNKTPNIGFAAACPLTNLTMSGCTKLFSGITIEINRAKDAVTEAEWDYLRSIINNNTFSQIRIFYNATTSEYFKL